MCLGRGGVTEVRHRPRFDTLYTQIVDSTEAVRPTRVPGTDSLSRSFLATFNRIEKALDSLAGSYRAPGIARLTFYALVAEASKRSNIARYYSASLREYADLRNAIVHDSSGLPIAEPHAETVSKLMGILHELTKPNSLQAFTGVQHCGPHEEIGDVARRMRDGRFSQMPVYSTAVSGLLTGETIARWLASRLERDQILMSEKVSAVMEHTEDPDNYVILARHDTVYDAKAKFDDYQARGKSLDAIVVSNSRKATDRPLGIITVFDYPALVPKE